MVAILAGNIHKAAGFAKENPGGKTGRVDSLTKRRVAAPAGEAAASFEARLSQPQRSANTNDLAHSSVPFQAKPPRVGHPRSIWDGARIYPAARGWKRLPPAESGVPGQGFGLLKKRQKEGLAFRRNFRSFSGLCSKRA
jgi:hypothetical protein